MIALSPLLDVRGVAALLDLRARGYDLVVLEISPLARGDADSPEPALRLWRLQRDALRSRFEALGIPVARWEPRHAPVEMAVEEVSTLRRHARSARV